jgi:hypothetical protein
MEKLHVQNNRLIYIWNVTDSFQARYRQCFEEDPDVGGDAMIPMETQVLMQEVLTDGIAFCSVM